MRSILRVMLVYAEWEDHAGDHEHSSRFLLCAGLAKKKRVQTAALVLQSLRSQSLQFAEHARVDEGWKMLEGM